GGGGPFLGPYVTASATFTSAFPLDATSYTTTTYNAGNSTGAADLGAVVSWGGNTAAHTLSFSIRRNSDNTYWNGSAFSGTTQTFNPSTSCTGTGCTSSNNSATYLYTFAPSEGFYTVQARAVDDQP